MTATTFSLFTLDAFFKLGDWAIYLTAPLMMGIAAHTPVGWAMAVSRHDIAGIWVAFFSRCQRYLR